MVNLVIVESASKSKTIQKIISSSDALKDKGTFKVIASSGHVIDLPKKEIGVNTDTWSLKYETMKEKSKLIHEIKRLAKESDNIYLAADPDREGEAIAWHINNLLKVKNSKRVTFNEITKNAIEHAILNPRELDIPLIDAQESRRALDRIVGYKVSPLLWKKFPSAKALSAGRVQSAALAEIIQRYIEYTTFDKEFYWNIEAQFKLSSTKIDTSLYKKNNKNIHNFESKEQVIYMLEELKNPTEWIFDFNKTITYSHPSAPYTTSSLQQEAYEKYHINAKQTMAYAQKLYEKGYITYIRTDSVSISEDAKNMIHTYLRDKFDNNIVYNRSFKNKIANAQEAHECIRPSKIYVIPEQIDDNDLVQGHIKLYDLIWRRAVSSQMQPAEYIQYTFTINNSIKSYYDYEFRGKVSLLNKLGYLEIWQPTQEVKHGEIIQWDSILETESKIKLKKVCANGNITRPKNLYNEPRLIKWMESEGIGRPSTYSTVMNKLFDKGYIYKGKPPVIQVEVEHYVLDKNNIKCNKKEIKIGNNEKDCNIPSDIGIKIIEYLKNTIPNIIDKTFTADMEEELDKVSRNEMTKQQLLSKFYQPFEQSINNVITDTDNSVSNTKNSNIIKEYDNVKLINTRYGPSLFIEDTKKYISVTPYIEWKKKSLQEITDEDVTFLINLPKKYNDINIEFGRYGMYMIYKSKNYRLPKKEWIRVYNNDINYLELKQYIK